MHRFRNKLITTFTAQMIACDLEKSFSFDMKVEVTSHVHFLIRVYNIVVSHLRSSAKCCIVTVRQSAQILSYISSLFMVT